MMRQHPLLSMLLVLIVLLIGCARAQEGRGSAETSAINSEDMSVIITEFAVAAVDIATGEKRWVDDVQPDELDAIPLISPDSKYEILPTDSSVQLKTGATVTSLDLAGEQTFIGWLPDSTAFVIASNATGPNDWQTFELYLVSAENPTQIEQLTQHSNVAYSDVAPSGQTIAFTSNANSDDTDAYQLYTLDLAGKTVTQITERDAAFVRWSPNGEWIAFSSYEANRDIYMVRPDGSHLTRLTTSMADEWGVRWSDDGASVLFLSEQAVTAPSYQTAETYEAAKSYSKTELRQHHEQVNQLLTGAPFFYSVGSGNANNRVELTVSTEEEWQQFIADANFELPPSVVVLFAHEAGFDTPPLVLNSPDGVYLATMRFPPTIIEGVGFSQTRIVEQDGCIFLRDEISQALNVLVVPPNIFLHEDGGKLHLLSSEGDIVATVNETPVGGGMEFSWDRLPPMQTPIPDHCRVGSPIYTTEFLLGEAIVLPDDSDHYAADLINRKWLWRQTVMNDSTTIPTHATADFTPYLTFSSKPAASELGGEMLTGNMGCNSFSGAFLANISGFMQLRINTQTVENCPEPQNASEALWQSLVSNIASFKIESGLLYMQTEAGDVLTFADGGVLE